MVKRLISKIQKTGWRSLPSIAYNFMQYHIKFGFQKVNNHISNLTLHKQVIAKIFPFEKPPILFLAYPRSGSSWIGEILGHSPNLAYLREPITQALIQKHGYNVFTDPRQDPSTFELFNKYTKRAFLGIPPEGVKDVIIQKSDFAPWSRAEKQVLIKEVNPLAAKFFVDRYSPRLIILLRHPAAVADSFHRMGWLKDDWERFGQIYGTRMKNALEHTTHHQRTLIYFEDIARDPLQSFKMLFEKLNTKPPGDFERLIERYSNARRPVSSPYQKKRYSAGEINKWRKNLDHEAIEAVKKGYLESGFPYYQQKSDW